MGSGSGWFRGHVVRDRDGRLVVPFFQEPADEVCVPQGWIPTDYLHRLRDIPLRPEAGRLDGEHKHGQPGWARIEGAYSVANRGLLLEDLVSLSAHRLAVPCERDAP